MDAITFFYAPKLVGPTREPYEKSRVFPRGPGENGLCGPGGPRRGLKIDHVWPPSRTRASWPPPRARGPPPVPQGRPRRTVRSGPSGKRRRGRYFCAHLMGPAAGMWEEEGSKVFKKSDEKRDSRSKYHFASNGTALVPRPTPSLVPVSRRSQFSKGYSLVLAKRALSGSNRSVK